MANREACELWIEQEVEIGLKEGKTPYKIGKELHEDIREIFHVKIPATTIKMRAERQKKDLVTNVTKQFKTTDNSESTEFKSREGTPRPNAGRPFKPFDFAKFRKDWAETSKELADLMSQSVGLDLNDTETQIGLMVIEAGYRAVSKKLHPDVGGSTEGMTTLNLVKEKLINALS